MKNIPVRSLHSFIDKEVSLVGWVQNFRTSGSIYFIELRDGSGMIQCIVSKDEISAVQWAAVEQITLETAVQITGIVQKHPHREEYEVHVSGIEMLQIAEEYPIGKKEHGVDFLMDNRHLWIRSPRQSAILRLRSLILKILHDFYTQEGFYLTHTPSITANACEGSTDLFCIDYFGAAAYLSQNGQLYLEALAMALGKVYDLNPNFRAEKSSTRRHLIEFWTLNPEIAFCHLEESIEYQERTFQYLCAEVLRQGTPDLRILERDTRALEKAAEGNYPRLTHKEAVAMLQKLGSNIGDREDLGADDESILTKQFDRPIFITRYPAEVKAFYMEPDPEDESRVLNNDMLAPEGYGEIIGGSERISDYDLLVRKIQENGLKVEDYGWYLDLRRYGSAPHSGYGIGIERTVAWLCGLSHVRESIPFARTLHRVRP